MSPFDADAWRATNGHKTAAYVLRYGPTVPGGGDIPTTVWLAWMLEWHNLTKPRPAAPWGPAVAQLQAAASVARSRRRLFRGEYWPEGAIALRFRVGQPFRITRLTSATTSYEAAHSYAIRRPDRVGVVLVLDDPAGVRGLEVPEVISAEGEVILPAGAVFTVTKITRPAGIIRVEMEGAES